MQAFEKVRESMYPVHAKQNIYLPLYWWRNMSQVLVSPFLERQIAADVFALQSASSPKRS